jgi:hypothetical protein
MNNTIKLLEEKYNQVVLSEMQQKYIDMVKEVKKDLPFDNIFGKNLRIILPFSQNQTYNELKSEISNLPGFVQWNPDKKEVIRKVHYRKPNGEEGTKDQILNIGKAISLLKISPEKKKEYLNWFSNYSNNFKELEEMSKYSIILSRHPIDVVRMSDAKNIYSCHSEGNDYFQCAIQEAKTGGPIAYIVKTDELKQVDPKKIQNDEIFADKLRDIKGIIPISRLRIRRYTDDNETNYAIPEGRIYGENIPGFVNTVKTFLQEKQKDIINPSEIIKKFKEKKIYKRGGTYSDSSDSELFNKFLGTNELFQSLYHYKPDSAEEDTNLNNTEELQARMNTELRDIKSKYDYSFTTVDYEVFAEDAYVAYYATAFTRIGIMLKDIKKIDLQDFNLDRSIISRLNNSSKEEVEKNYPKHDFKILNLILNFLEIADLSIADIEQIKFERKENTESNIYITWRFNYSNSSYDVDKFDDFCEELRSHDDDVDFFDKAFQQALYKSGYLRLRQAMNNYEKFQLKELEFYHFSYDADEFITQQVLPINLNDNQWKVINNKKMMITSEISDNIIKKYQEFFSKNRRNNDQLTFKQFSEGWTSYGRDLYVNTDIKYNTKSGGKFSSKITNILTIDLKISKSGKIFDPNVIDFMIEFDKEFTEYCKYYVVGIIYLFIPNNLLLPDQIRMRDFYVRNIKR